MFKYLTIPIKTSLRVPSKTNGHLTLIKIPNFSKHWLNYWSDLDVLYSSELHPAHTPRHTTVPLGIRH